MFNVFVPNTSSLTQLQLDRGVQTFDFHYMTGEQTHMWENTLIHGFKQQNMCSHEHGGKKCWALVLIYQV